MLGRGRGQRGKLREWSAWGGGGGGGGGGEGEEAEGRRKRWRKGSEGKNGTREYDIVTIIHTCKCACRMKGRVKVCSATQHFGQRYVYCQNCTKTH